MLTSPGRVFGIQLQPHKSMFAVGLSLYFGDRRARIIHRDVRSGQVLAVEQDHDGRLETGPPIGRLDLRDVGALPGRANAANENARINARAETRERTQRDSFAHLSDPVEFPES